MFIYLAQPIDQARGRTSELRGLLAYVSTNVTSQGHSMYHPARAFTLGQAPAPSPHGVINAINHHALDECDALIAVLAAGVPTLGVPAEIELALSRGMPVAIFASESLITGSVQLADWASRGAQILQHGDTVEWSRFDWDKPPIVREWLGVDEPTGDLQVVYMDAAAKPLQRAHPTDAGLDLATLEDCTLQHGVRTLIRTGIQAPPPEGWWGLIKARSSTTARGIQIDEAVIDAGYQGELMISATLIDPGRSLVLVQAGTRLAQYILVPAFPGKVARVERFAPSARGDRGWGSSGS